MLQFWSIIIDFQVWPPDDKINHALLLKRMQHLSPYTLQKSLSGKNLKYLSSKSMRIVLCKISCFASTLAPHLLKWRHVFHREASPRSVSQTSILYLFAGMSLYYKSLLWIKSRLWIWACCRSDEGNKLNNKIARRKYTQSHICSSLWK